MTYCTVDDVRVALTQSGETSGTNTAADMNDLTLDDAIAEAGAQVDVYIGGPYRTDLGDVVPGPIKYLTRDVAAFLATCTWRKSKDFAANDPVLLRYNWAIQQLKDINSGASSLADMPTSPEDMATVINNYNFNLFYPWQFDLTGRGRTFDEYGQPARAWTSGGWIFWQ